MEKEKYYTPTIEEFGINFEYQYFKSNGAGNFWLDDKITFFSELCGDGGVEEMLSDGKIRVKYLDREDIESFGYRFLSDRMLESNCNWFYKSDYKSERSDETESEILFNPNNGWVLICEYYDGKEDDKKTRFAGYIKNKSEFSRLLKQLSII